nr:MAG TPA: hypothetical protein [Caudoviricetes sp.]
MKGPLSCRSTLTPSLPPPPSRLQHLYSTTSAGLNALYSTARCSTTPATVRTRCSASSAWSSSTRI